LTFVHQSDFQYSFTADSKNCVCLFFTSRQQCCYITLRNSKIKNDRMTFSPEIKVTTDLICILLSLPQIRVRNAPALMGACSHVRPIPGAIKMHRG